MPTRHNHPLVAKADLAGLNAQYAPWRIEKWFWTGRAFTTQVRNTETGEVIYRCEGWNQASRGQALNAILELPDAERYAEEYVSSCPACGDPIDYCQGHGEIGDPVGFAILQAHDSDDHSGCHPDGCDSVS